MKCDVAVQTIECPTPSISLPIPLHISPQLIGYPPGTQMVFYPWTIGQALASRRGTAAGYLANLTEDEEVDAKQQVLRAVCSKAKRNKLDIKFTHTSAVRRNVDKHIVRVIAKYAKGNMDTVRELIVRHGLKSQQEEIVIGFLEALANLENNKGNAHKNEKVYAKIICGMIANPVLKVVLYNALLQEEEQMKAGFWGKISRANVEIYKTTILEYRSYLSDVTIKQEVALPTSCA